MRKRPEWKIRKVGDTWVVSRLSISWFVGWRVVARVSSFAAAVATIEAAHFGRRTDYGLAAR